jgi:hypothetical protein
MNTPPEPVWVVTWATMAGGVTRSKECATIEAAEQWAKRNLTEIKPAGNRFVIYERDLQPTERP